MVRSGFEPSIPLRDPNRIAVPVSKRLDFADSPLEGDGFEPTVPRGETDVWHPGPTAPG